MLVELTKYGKVVMDKLDLKNHPKRKKFLTLLKIRVLEMEW